MSLLTPIALGLILAVGIFFTGGKELPQWYFCLAGFGVVSVIYFAIRARRRRWIGMWPRLMAWMLGIAAGVCLLQLVPLPAALLRIVSPASYALYQSASAFTGTSGFYPISVTPAATLDMTLNLGGCIVVFWIVSDLAARGVKALPQLAMPLVAIGALEGLLGVLQAATGSKPTGSTGTYGNRDHFAEMLAMILPLAFMLAVSAWRRYREGAADWGAIFETCLWGGAAAVMLLGAGTSISRMGFVAALAALLVSGAAVLWIDRREGQFRRRRGWRLRVAGAAGLFLIAVILVPSGALILRYSATAQTAGEFTSDARFGMWRDTLPLIAHFPIFGCGFGAYESAMTRYQTVIPLMAIDYAHEDYLQLMAELGLVGFLPLLLVAALTYRAALKHLMQNHEGLLYAACLGSFAAITLHSLVDFNLYRSTSAVILAWIAGMAVGERAQPRVES